MAVTSAVTGELIEACQYGLSGHCGAGQHDQCAHRPGGRHDHGHESPLAMLCRRGHGKAPSSWFVVGPDLWLDCRVCGRRHGHVWRCPCDCHTPAGIAAAAAAAQAARLAVDEQLELLLVGAA